MIKKSVVLVFFLWTFTATECHAIGIGNFAITSDKHSENENLAQIVQSEFGSDYRIADWNDIVAYYSSTNDVELFEQAFGPGSMLTYNGNRWYSSSRQYFYSISKRPGQTPHDGYLSHANIDNHTFDLGSWYNRNLYILVYTDSPNDEGKGEYAQGYEDGRQACIDNPASCGITASDCEPIPLEADLSFHLPRINYNSPAGLLQLWADFAFTPIDNRLLFEVVDFGEVVTDD
ncbi:MAG: hypothetical protein ABFS56_35030 [Pseudomonadota bacterium]